VEKPAKVPSRPTQPKEANTYEPGNDEWYTDTNGNWLIGALLGKSRALICNRPPVSVALPQAPMIVQAALVNSGKRLIFLS